MKYLTLIFLLSFSLQLSKIDCGGNTFISSSTNLPPQSTTSSIVNINIILTAAAETLANFKASVENITNSQIADLNQSLSIVQGLLSDSKNLSQEVINDINSVIADFQRYLNELISFKNSGRRKRQTLDETPEQTCTRLKAMIDQYDADISSAGNQATSAQNNANEITATNNQLKTNQNNYDAGSDNHVANGILMSMCDELGASFQNTADIIDQVKKNLTPTQESLQKQYDDLNCADLTTPEPIYPSSAEEIFSSSADELSSSTDEIFTSSSSSVEISPGGNKCGSLIRYDPIKDPTAPARDGFSAGLFENGTHAYVGAGNCPNQTILPGRLSVVNGAGAHISCPENVLDSTTSQYLQNHPALQWVTIIPNYAFVIGALTINNGEVQNVFGRTFITNGDGKRYVGVGRATFNDEFSEIYYYSSSGNLLTSTSFEILTCNPKGISVCGTFEPYDPKYNPIAPVDRGFSAGSYLDGTEAYVGLGSTTGCENQYTMPARLTIGTPNEDPGAYMACNKKLKDTISPQFLRSHPSLKWVSATPSTALGTPYVISTGFGYFDYFIGRKNITSSSGTIYTVVSKVHYDYGVTGFYYSDDQGTTVSENSENSTFEVLTCQP